MFLRVTVLLSLLLASHSYATFSIVAIDPVTKEVGSAGGTCINNFSLASAITRIVPSKGAVNFQAYANSGGFPLAVQSLQVGTGAQGVMDTVNAADNSVQNRQNLAITLDGNKIETAAFTGTVPQGYGGWAGSIKGPDYVIAGNLLLGSHVLTAMQMGYENAQGDLRDRLMQAVAAASAITGADQRCLNLSTSVATAYVRVSQPTDAQGQPSYYIHQDSIVSGEDPLRVIYKRYHLERPDDDGDFVSNIYDAFPNDSSESKDSDGDGIGDNSDPYPLDPHNGRLVSCNEPVLDPASDRGVFVWQDCNGSTPSGRWTMQIVGGGVSDLTGIEARVTALSANANLLKSSFEQSDSAELSASGTALDMAMKVYNSGVDTIVFDAGVKACLQLTPSSGVSVAVGQNKTSLTTNNLALTAGLACDVDNDGDGLSDGQEAIVGSDAANADTDSGGVSDGDEIAAGTDPLIQSDDQTVPSYCGAPAINPASDRGYYLWKDCTGTENKWSLRLFAGGGQQFQLAVLLEDNVGLSNVAALSFENNDILDDSDLNAVNVTMSAWNTGVDGVDFTTNGSACFKLLRATGLNPNIGILLGRNQSLVVSSTIDLVTGSSCQSTTSDLDADGLTDVDEMRLGTNPIDPDSDGDRLSDGDEVHRYNTDPLRANTDRDGLSDWAEVIHFGTDPLDADTDDDGLNDGPERKLHKTDPLKADTDGGGISDGDEIGQGTDPLDASDD